MSNLPKSLRDLVRECPLFDSRWYSETYRDVGLTGLDPVEHFVRFGSALNRAPGPQFDCTAYLRAYPDVQTAGQNAFVHYLTSGAREGRRTYPLMNGHSHAVETARIIQFTPATTRNPFFTMIGRQLTSLGFDYKYCTDRKQIINDALLSGGSSVVHFHQLDPLYHTKSKSVAETEEKAKSLIDFLKQIKAAGGHIALTRHNPAPHDSYAPEIDRMVDREASTLCDGIIILGAGIANELRDFSEKIIHIPHPTFKEHYGPAASKDAARKLLRLPQDVFLFGSIGELKPYKQHDVIIDAFRIARDRWRGTRRPALLIAGNPTSEEYVDRLKSCNLDDVYILPRDIPDADMALHVSSLDASAFSFSRMWVSGSVILSISYGVPVIAPDLGCLDEYVSHENTGLLYTPGDADDLADKMIEIGATPFMEHYAYMCGALESKNRPSRIARMYADAYRRIAGLR